MPLGDSTTASICYRSYLWQMLTAAGHTQFDFVGTRRGNPGCTFSAYDQDNEGHGGYVVSDVLKAAGTGVRPGGADTTDPFVSDSRDLATWFDGHPADVVIMHFGTNDVWNSAVISSQRVQTILMAYDAILARLAPPNSPNVRLLVAQITPLAPGWLRHLHGERARALDDLIPGWASANTRPESPRLGGRSVHRIRTRHRHRRRRALEQRGVDEDRDELVRLPWRLCSRPHQFMTARSRVTSRLPMAVCAAAIRMLGASQVVLDGVEVQLLHARLAAVPQTWVTTLPTAASWLPYMAIQMKYAPGIVSRECA